MPQLDTKIPSNIPIPKIIMGKRKQRSQMCEVFTEDGRILQIEFDVLRGCIEDQATGQAFLIDSANQYTDERGYWVQVLGERSTIPVCMISPTKVNDLKGLINNIYYESYQDAKMQQYIKAAKAPWLERITWIVAIPCICALLMFAIQHFSGGK
jgi:hypothetical protein